MIVVYSIFMILLLQKTGVGTQNNKLIKNFHCNALTIIILSFNGTSWHIGQWSLPSVDNRDIATSFIKMVQLMIKKFLEHLNGNL